MRLLKPIVRLLLRHQIPYGAFSDMAKWVYADVAMREFGVKTRKQTQSRVAVITGLTRKEVARLQKITKPDDDVVAQEYNRAVRVINGWLTDAKFQNADKKPSPLEVEGEKSFSALVKEYSGDVPVGAILDELMNSGAVTKDESGRICLQQHGYVPASSEKEIVHILGTDVALLLDTIDHNLVEGQTNPYFQRKVAYNNLPVECLAEFRELSGEKAMALLEELNRYLMQHDRDVNPKSQGSGRKRAGVGIYYFEEDMNDKE